MKTRGVQYILTILFVLGLSATITACAGPATDLGVAPVDAADPPAAVAPTVAIAPLSGPPGTLVDVVATGFPPLTRVLVGMGPQGSEFRDVVEGVSDADGVFVAQVPAEGGPGMALVFAVRAEGQPGVLCPDLFHVIAPREPAVAITPLSGPPGTLVEVVATDFPPLTRVLVGMGPQGSEFRDVAEGVSDAEGVFVAQVPAEGAPGMALVFAVRAEGQPGVLCPDLFHVIAPREPAVTIAPLSGPPGTLVEVVATGFPPHTRVLVGMGPQGSEFRDVAEGVSDAEGVFVAQVPAEGGPGMALVFAVRAEGQPGVLCPDLFHVTAPREPAVAITPLSGPPGTLVDVVAADFPPLTRVLVGMGPQGSEFREVAEGVSDAEGVFVAQVPAEGGPGMALVFAVRAEGQPGVLCPDLFYVTESTTARDTYSNPLYAIILEYPAHWQPVPGSWDPQLGEVSFGTEDGFFLVSALESPGSIDDTAAGQANHALLPYGSQPTIESILVAGQEARLIWPSADQYPSMRNQAALIVRYPQPVSILGHLYNFFLLYADRDHVRDIADTLRFEGE